MLRGSKIFGGTAIRNKLSRMSGRRASVSRKKALSFTQRVKFASSVPPVALKIFEYLCARDISSCCLVCKLWYYISEKIMKERLDVFVKSKAYVKYQFKDEPSHLFCSLEEIQLSFGKSFQTALYDMWIVPKVVIVFGSPDFMHRPDKLYYTPALSQAKSEAIGMTVGRESVVLEENPQKVMKFQKMLYFIEDRLPKRCPVVCCENHLTGGVFDDRHTCMAVDGLTALSFPDLPGVEICAISLLADDFTLGFAGKMYTNIKLFGLSGLSPRVEHKLLIVFHFHTEDQQQISQLYQILYNYNCEIAIGVSLRSGCSLHRLSNRSHPLGSGLLFAGKNIKTHCVTLHNESDMNCVVAQLKIVKKFNVPEEKCMAFMSSSDINKEILMLKLLSTIFENIPVFNIVSEVAFMNRRVKTSSCICGKCNDGYYMGKELKFNSKSIIVFLIFNV